MDQDAIPWKLMTLFSTNLLTKCINNELLRINGIRHWAYWTRRKIMSSGQISGTKCCQLRNLAESLFEQYLGQSLCLKYPPLAFTQAKSKHCHFWIVAIMIPVFILGPYSFFQFFKWTVHVFPRQCGPQDSNIGNLVAINVFLIR